MDAGEHAFAAAGPSARSVRNDYIAAHGTAANGFGFAHAVTTDMTSPVVRYLPSNSLADGLFDGQVWIKYPLGKGSGDIDLAEAIFEAASKALTAKLGITVYASVRND